MLTPDEIDGFRVATGRLIDPVADYLLRDIAKRIQEAGKLTTTAAYEAWRLEWMGKGRKDMEAELARLLGVSRYKAQKLLQQAATHGYELTREQFPHALPYESNEGIKQIVSAAVSMVGEELQNLTQTKAIGMFDPDGNFVSIPEAYERCCDYAFKRVITGATDYNTAIREACAGISKHGVKLTYASGVRTTLEAAVRRNIMGGLGLMTEQIEQRNHDDLGCDGWEISAHAFCAPDHEHYQGKRYPDAEYQSINSSLVRRIGTLNCGHVAFPVIMGVNAPQYTPAQLRQFREDNEKGVTFEGRHYTGYEATQMQRKLERAIRAQKRHVTMAAPEDQETAKMRLSVLQQGYRRFSRGVGLRTEDERLEVSGFEI